MSWSCRATASDSSKLAAAALRASHASVFDPEHPLVANLSTIVLPSQVAAINFMRRENVREWAPKPRPATIEFAGVLMVLLVSLLAASSVVFLLLRLSAR